MPDLTPDTDERRASNRAIVDRFCDMRAGSDLPQFYKEESGIEDLLAEDFVFEVPYAPRNMPKVYMGESRLTFFDWLERTIPDFRQNTRIVYETTDPCVFWFEDEGEGAVTWGKGGLYHNRHITLVKLNEAGRIILYREYFNPLQKLEVSGAQLPRWDYNEERVRVGLEPVPIDRSTEPMPSLADDLRRDARPWDVAKPDYIKEN